MDNNQPDTKQEIKASFRSLDAPLENEARKELQSQNADRYNVANRTKLLTDLLQNYVDFYHSRAKQSKKLRDDFYNMSIALLAFLAICFPVAILALLWLGKITDTNAAIGLISAAAGIVTSIIVLPKTIAEYLFSTEEDSKNADIVKEIIKSDLEIRNKLSSDDHTDGGTY